MICELVKQTKDAAISTAKGTDGRVLPALSFRVVAFD
jgi:hypothetical protein